MMSASPPNIPDWRLQPKEFLCHLLRVAINRAHPAHTLAAHLPPPPRGKTVVLGAGKAAAAMVHAVETAWPKHAPLSGLVITRYGHNPPRPPYVAARVDIVEAAHPVPDNAGLAAAHRIMTLAQSLSADDLALCLISGGGSSLLTLPADGMTLANKQQINQQLLNSGASIEEINTLRKHLSRIKGGRLAAACGSAQVVTLAISDVPGNDLSIIASGPTVPDKSTCAQALTLAGRYHIELPPSVLRALEAGLLETPKPGDTAFQRHRVHLIATPRQAMQAAAQLAQSVGVAAYLLSDAIEGEAQTVGQMHAALAIACARATGAFQPPCVLLSGGETTVNLAHTANPGRGGRNSEFCLGFLKALTTPNPIWALAADTDGIDGIQNNAGAIITPDTLTRATALGLNLTEHLTRHDAYGFFSALGDLVVTGPTHTNVNDFRAVLVL